MGGPHTPPVGPWLLCVDEQGEGERTKPLVLGRYSTEGKALLAAGDFRRAHRTRAGRRSPYVLYEDPSSP